MMKALYTWPSEPMIKLTRTFISSSSGCSNGSGVSKASGGRTSPHFGKASGSDTGENSEMCAGTWPSVFSSCESGGRCRTMPVQGVTEHHAATPHRTDNGRTADSSLLPAVFAMRQFQRHCIKQRVAIRLPAFDKLQAFTLNHLMPLLVPVS